VRFKVLLGALVIAAVALAISFGAQTLPNHRLSETLSDYQVDVLLRAEAGEVSAQMMMGEWQLDGSVGFKDEFQARKWFRLAAEQGHADAQFALADLIVSAFPYTPDDASDDALAESNQWLRLAAEQGHVEASKALGYRYWQGEGIEKNDAEAVRWMERAARKGDSLAQSFLADAYAHGEGVQPDPVEAAAWNLKAAQSGLQSAQLELGVAFKEGNGVPQDAAQAVHWLTLAAEGDYGLAEAKLELARLYLRGDRSVQDKDRAVSLYTEIGDVSPEAQYELAMAYISGEAVPPKADWRLDPELQKDAIEMAFDPRAASSPKEAADVGRDLLVGSAEAGFAQAQLELGLMIMSGEGWAADPAVAVHWLRAAADQGLADAQYALGYSYGTGEGVAKDEKEAYRLMLAAADQGNAKAQNAVAWHAYNGKGTVQDSAVAVTWYRRAALQGDPVAQRYLGRHYALGEGVPQNNLKAHMWTNIALSNGYDVEADLRDKLNGLSTSLSPEDLAAAQAMASACVTSGYANCGEPGQAE